MRLDVSYNMCSKSGSKQIFFVTNYDNFSFARPVLDFDCIFLIVILEKVEPDKIYALARRPAAAGSRYMIHVSCELLLPGSVGWLRRPFSSRLKFIQIAPTCPPTSLAHGKI